MKMKHRAFSISKLITCSALLVVLAGCGASKLNVQDQNGNPIVGASGVYTLVNLHPDPANQRLYTVNYQQAGLIPACTPVRIKEATTEVVIFEADGQEYEYIRHKTLGIPFEQHIQKFFGKDCPKDKIAGLSQRDQEGIEQGIAKLGMTKEGVRIAMGPPPAHATRSLDSDKWMYWQNRFGRKEIQFENGKVSKIVD